MVDPSVSTECSRFTMALRLAIWLTPTARVTVTTAGRPSGMAATARATAPSMAVLKSAPWTTCSTKTSATAPIAMIANRRLSPSSWRSSGVGPGSAAASSSATLPISVRMPVSVTTSSARPLVTVVLR